MVGAQVKPLFMYTELKVRYDSAVHKFEILKPGTFHRTTVH